MVTIGKYNGDINCWGLSHNDFHRVAMQIPENIDVQLNSTDNNAPLVLKSGSMFYVWGSSGITISANSSGNASYPAASTYDYFRPSAIFTSTDFAPVWGSTAISSTGGNATYYMVCKGGVDSTAIGQGQIDYLGSSIFTPAYSALMSGWYGTTAGSTEWRALGRFIMTSGAMSKACVFKSRCHDPGYVSNVDVYSTGTNVYIGKFTADLGAGKSVQYLQEVNVATITGLTASTWYAIGLSEGDGTLVNSSLAGGWTGWTITGNQLNAYSIYDADKNFCRAQIASTYHRALNTYRVSSGSSTLAFNFKIEQAPVTNIQAISTGSTAFTSAIYSSFPVTTIEYDLLSELSTATSFIAVVPKSDARLLFRGGYLWNPTSYIVTAAWFYQAEKRGTGAGFGANTIFGRQTFPAASTSIFIHVQMNNYMTAIKNDVIEIALYPGSTGANTQLASSVYNHFEVIGV